MNLANIPRRKGLLWCAAIMIGLAANQKVLYGQAQPATPKVVQASWSVLLKENAGAYFLSVHGKDIPLTQVAAELSRQLKAPVILSRVMQKQKVTISFEDLPFETALQMLAPLPYVHYELRGGSTPFCRSASECI